MIRDWNSFEDLFIASCVVFVRRRWLFVLSLSKRSNDYDAIPDQDRRVLKELFITLLWMACTPNAYPDTESGDLSLKFRENITVPRLVHSSFVCIWVVG